MKIIVVGNGGREHALAWKFLQSPQVERVFCVPGNGGTAVMECCQNLPLKVEDFEGIARFATENDVSLVAVGPELPLSLGIADYLLSQNIPVFGPTKAGAEIEASKAWAKALMAEAGIPTAKSAVFTDAGEAIAYIKAENAPIVVKADGLAAGKGVTVAQTVEEAVAAVEDIFQDNFAKVVIEECLIGEEVSVLALTDGLTIRPLLPAQDHKRIGDGDTGPNTGGMGAYAPAPLCTPALLERVEKEVLQPTIATLQKRGIPYVGVVYAGLMISPSGEPKVLEFNCRFGDPETQAILPLLETPLEDLMLACTQQRLAEMPPIEWKSGACVCVVMASGGYPGEYEKGKLITGIESAQTTGAIVFHAGTKLSGGVGERGSGGAGELHENADRSFPYLPVTDGGRVLGVTAIGENIEGAIATAYAAVDRIQFEGAYSRRDIAQKAIKRKE
ncbi:phosphoribosylamine--glycine ligase [Aerosakkonema funiforme]|uniref:phosphoribosylamine--glycine ligase n=1 Tax=Aerosakkonema funiforme TaxID=1246630 RepID=UPI0035B8A9C9